MKIIDFHTHIYPAAIAEKATKSIEDFYCLDGGGMNGTPEQLILRGKSVGIEKYVVLPVAIKPEHTRSINEFLINEVKTRSEFIGFGTVHAGQPDVAAEGEFIIESGLKGIKMHPDTQLFNIDDERLFPLYEAVGDKLIFMFHLGDKRYDFSHPRRLRRVMDLFPKMRVVATHLGGFSVWEEAEELLLPTNCMLDISSSLMFMDSETQQRYIKLYSADRLLYGTDFPLWDPVAEVGRFMQIPMSSSDREKIAYRNAEQILNIKL